MRFIQGTTVVFVLVASLGGVWIAGAPDLDEGAPVQIAGRALISSDGLRIAAQGAVTRTGSMADGGLLQVRA